MNGDGLVVRGARDEAVPFVAGRSLLRAVVAELVGIPVETVAIEARCPDCGGAHGRPRLSAPAALAEVVHVSLTHAAGWSFAAASLRGTVGIDAEPRAGDPDRLRAIEQLTGAAATSDPLRHWTRVEAALKADGRGLRVDPAAVSVEPCAAGEASLCALVPGSRARYLLRDVELDVGVGAGWCVSLALEERRERSCG